MTWWHIVIGLVALCVLAVWGSVFRRVLQTPRQEVDPIADQWKQLPRADEVLRRGDGA